MYAQEECGLERAHSVLMLLRHYNHVISLSVCDEAGRNLEIDATLLLKGSTLLWEYLRLHAV